VLHYKGGEGEMPTVKTKPFLLPYEPASTEHLQAEERRRSTRLFLKRRIAALEESPSITPDLPAASDKPSKRGDRNSD
jgi:hypothetical protein